MKGLRTFGLWAVCPKLHMERTTFRVLGATRFISVNSSIRPDRNQQSMTLIKPTQYLFYSQVIGNKARNYWSAIATGLLYMTGISFIFYSSEENVFFRNLFIAVQCAKKNDLADKCDCGCKKDCLEKECHSSTCLRKNECDEEVIRKANQDLEFALKDNKEKLLEYTEAAIKAYCEAIVVIKEFMNKVYCAVNEVNLDSPRFDDVWADVYKSLKQRCDKAQEATEKGACAYELLKRYREVIKEGKCCKYTSCNPLLLTAEEFMKCAEKEICERKREMEKVLRESRPVEQYRNLVEEFRRDLKAEADSLLPSGCCVATLNHNEANLIFGHAYKKILRIQREMDEALGGKECKESKESKEEKECDECKECEEE